MRVVLESLKVHWLPLPIELQRLMHYAVSCRATSVMKPYLEAIC